MTRKKYSKEFKTKVVLESLKERHTLKELAQKHNIHPQQITNWKKQFLDKASLVFDKKGGSEKSEAEQREDALLKTIGQQKVEIDFLKKALR